MVIATIGILVALLLPAIQAAREAARRTSCLNKIRQIVLASQNFADSNGHFPASSDVQFFSHLAQILPYHEEKNLHDLIDYDFSWDDPENQQAADTPVPIFKCPSIDGGQPTWINVQATKILNEDSEVRGHYIAVMGAKNDCPSKVGDPYTVETSCGGGNPDGIATNGIMYPQSEIGFRHITDGSSNTFLIGEMAWFEDGISRVWIIGSTRLTLESGSSIWSYGGKNIRWPMKFWGDGDQVANNRSFGSEHPGGAHFGMADGSGRFISKGIDMDLYKALASRDAGEVIELP